jgi:UDP-N-acetylglucosamine:LPS N-acetylglucosamine transferase
MGAGHEGAARELRRRMLTDGHDAVVMDFLAAFPRPVAWLWRESYHVQMRRFPDSYERSYRLYYSPSRIWPWLLRAATWLAHRRLERWLAQHRPDVVVSTYPFATLVLGELRAQGRLSVPLVNYLTDLGVHPRCVHESADMNLVPHKVSARAAEDLVDVPTVVTGPVVDPSFDELASTARAAARGRLAIGDEEVAVLVLAGSWGVGRVRETVDALLAAGRFHVVVACGNDRRLQADLETRRGHLNVLGWTDDMAGVVAAADVVVENAGGLSAFEAMAAGVPVITYSPIPGHGRDNAVAMEEAGITEQPDDPAALAEAIDRLARPGAERERRIASGRALFAIDPVQLIVEAARS